MLHCAHGFPRLPQRRRGHAEFPQAETDQDAQQRRIRRHLTADRHASPVTTRTAQDHPDQLEDGRMLRVVEMLHPHVAAVGGQRVLRQVVGPDAEERRMTGQAAGIEGRRRHFHHGAGRWSRQAEPLGLRAAAWQWRATPRRHWSRTETSRAGCAPAPPGRAHGADARAVPAARGPGAGRACRAVPVVRPRATPAGPSPPA